MEIFCTYCSKDKDENITSLPAIHLYRSKRIRKVSEASHLLGFPFFILSGKYGLISAEKRITVYDHLLTLDEVPLITQKIEGQLKDNEIDTVVFFHNSIESDNNILPYLQAIIGACKNEKIEIKLCLIDIPDEEDKSKNGYREIWQKAIKANQDMVKNRDINGVAFIELFQKYKNDGMLFYERGEAFESLHEFSKAQNDYEQALLFFPNPKWRNIAYEGLFRLINPNSQLKVPSLSNLIWFYFHRVNSFINLPHEIRVFVLSSFERFGEEKRLSIGELRICLELILIGIVEKNKDIINEEKTFCQIVNEQRGKNIIDTEVSKLMKDCWFLMSNIIHPLKNKIVRDEDYSFAITEFVRILERCNFQKSL
jgi:tetratricopeptide (TPR) repeat protein